MTVEETIKTAIDYEIKIRDIYREAVEAVDDEAGKRIFERLGDDEQNHVDYLQYQLAQLQETGGIVQERLDSVIPSQEAIDREAAKVESMLGKDFRGVRKQMLSRALQAEIETSEFYQKVVGDLPADSQVVFERFIEIENNHIKAVQFELDYISKTGYWLDFKEFDME